MGLSKIKIQQGNEWIEITEKKEMESALFRELRQRFNRQNILRFARGPFSMQSIVHWEFLEKRKTSWTALINHPRIPIHGQPS
jgi:hypothetical protein